MSTNVTRPPQETIAAINEQSMLVKSAATQLSNRIEIFSAWLGNLPGRVETTYYGQHPDDDGSGMLSFCLRLHRDGKAWIISFGNHHEQYNNEYPVEWKPLTEAPVRLKLLAIAQFPDLLEAIEKSQKQLATQIESACAEFDKFAANLGIEEAPAGTTTLTKHAVAEQKTAFQIMQERRKAHAAKRPIAVKEGE